MSFRSIKIFDVRNIKVASLCFSKNVNIFYGKNGSGKTSTLEALYLLATAKSFRTRKIQSLINTTSDKNELVVFGEVVSQDFEVSKIGVRKSLKDGTLIKIDDVIERSASSLAQKVATLALDPNCFNILEGSPSARRQFLDWGVFHVEHSYSKLWGDYKYCLKQRNILLRNRNLDLDLILVWERKLASLGEMVKTQRQKYISDYKIHLESLVEELCPELNGILDVYYQQGWDKKSDLYEVLDSSRVLDHKRKHTQHGSHRDDLVIKVAGKQATETLSRGQQKKLIIALYLAQILTIKEIKGINSVVLLDDITAELDEINTQKVIQYLLKLESQVFCTLLDLNVLGKFFNEQIDDYSMFHVEHGKITRIEN